MTLDFDPAADKRRVDVQASMTAMPFADGTVDLVICFHVLEHIPDDRAAMEELARVLAPTGWGLIQVPWRPGTRTDEDPGLPADERVERFGQRDHVRFYGSDFEDRLIEAGLELRRVEAGQLMGAGLCGWLGVSPQDPIWLVRPARHGGAGFMEATPDLDLALSVDSFASHLAAQLTERITDAEQELVRSRAQLTATQEKLERAKEASGARRRELRAARAEVRRLRGRLETQQARTEHLRSRRSVRLALAAASLAGRVRGRTARPARSN